MSIFTDMTLSSALLLISAILPLIFALMLGFKRLRILALHLAPWAALPTLMTCLLLPLNEMHWHSSEVLLGISLGLDETSHIFLLFASLLWASSGVYARAYFSNPLERARFYIFFLLAMAGNFGLIIAQDMLSFYVGFALMSFSSYGLVVFNASASAFRAGKVYIILVVAGELFLFASLLIASHATDAITFDSVRTGLIDSNNRDLIILLTLVGFGIKAGLLGVHVWLPLAHPVAPTPASAVLSGVMINAGLLGWLRLLPLGEVALSSWGTGIMLMGLIATFYGVIIGLTQREPKTLLAYSSISQMGIMTMATGLGLLLPNEWPVILPVIAFYALHHGLSKGSLFLGVGLADKTRHIQQYWIWLGMWLPALALAGAPWTSGMFAKLLLKAQTLHAPSPWDELLPVLLSISAVATALLMARLLYLIRPVSGSTAISTTPATGLIAPWFATLIVVLLTPWLFVTIPPDQKEISLITSFWPIITSVFIVTIILAMKLFHSVQPLPAGDILVLFERCIESIKNTRISWINSALLSIKNQWAFNTQLMMTAVSTLATAIVKNSEEILSRWNVAVMLLLIIGLSMSLIIL